MKRKRQHTHEALEGNGRKKIKTEKELKTDRREETDSQDQLSPPEQPCSGAENDRPFLPPEILDMIIKETMTMDGAMLHVLNRVSTGFKALTAAHLPWLYFRPEVAEDLELDERRDIHVSVKAIIQKAGRGSGLFFKMKELYGKNKRWRSAWLTMRHEKFGRYIVKDIFWPNVPPALPQEMVPRRQRHGQRTSSREQAALKRSKIFAKVRRDGGKHG
ncbi:unnamed protein product [Tetraodon nigroviridis]|uniref:(spotted green pufferfish) hypothetical protein n=1 Tax=Tetraodon nigroviridis TaxID=99883 RepID=Q4S4E4_TETNG|nr:unnamed protein product [Tetraodon nigroviridis]